MGIGNTGKIGHIVEIEGQIQQVLYSVIEKQQSSL